MVDILEDTEIVAANSQHYAAHLMVTMADTDMEIILL